MEEKIHVNEDGWPLDKSQYEIIQQIGSGAFGKVYNAKCIYNNRLVAIKILDIYDNDFEDIKSEIKTMKLIKNDNVLELFCSFVENTNLWLIMPLMDMGSAISFVKKNNCTLSEPIIAYIIKNILLGLEYIHQQNFIHRDVKGGNILINSDGTIVLSDFGVSAYLDVHECDSHNTFVGSPWWMAPEVIKRENYDNKIDIWSLGITTLELFIGKPPNDNLDPMAAIRKTVYDISPTIESYKEMSKKGSPALNNFISKCLQKNSSLRPTAKELLLDPFIKNAIQKKDFIKILKPDNIDIKINSYLNESNKSLDTDWIFPEEKKEEYEKNKLDDDFVKLIDELNNDIKL